MTGRRDDGASSALPGWRTAVDINIGLQGWTCTMTSHRGKARNGGFLLWRDMEAAARAANKEAGYVPLHPYIVHRIYAGGAGANDARDDVRRRSIGLFPSFPCAGFPFAVASEPAMGHLYVMRCHAHVRLRATHAHRPRRWSRRRSRRSRRTVPARLASGPHLDRDEAGRVAQRLPRLYVPAPSPLRVVSLALHLPSQDTAAGSTSTSTSKHPWLLSSRASRPSSP